jgi:hypothetical protein
VIFWFFRMILSTRLEHMFGPTGMVETVRKIAMADPSGGTSNELYGAAAAWVDVVSLATAGLAHVLGELDASGACDRDHGLSTGSWLAREANLPPGFARTLVKVGTALRNRLGEVDDAVIDGRVNVHHAFVLADACNPRVADKVAGLQGELVALAETTTFPRWRTEVRGIIELLDEDGAHEPNADLARNRLSITDTIDGVTYVSGQLVGAHALGVTTAIDTRADELFHRIRTDNQHSPDIAVPSRSTLRALAVAELCRAGHAVDIESTRPPKPEVTLVVNADNPNATTAADGTRLADGTTRTLRCDPELFAVVIDSLGVPLDMGRHVRLATTAQRRAMAARDGTCVFPGCTTPPGWCDAHHLDPFATGGRTDLANLASLCRHHHGVTHRNGWHMHATPDGWYWWQTPTGYQIWSQRHGHQHPGPAPPPPTPNPTTKQPATHTQNAGTQ